MSFTKALRTSISVRMNYCAHNVPQCQSVSELSELRVQMRKFSTPDNPLEPVLDVVALQRSLLNIVPKMSKSLDSEGYYTTTDILETSMIQRLRDQSIALRESGRFEQSWSEKIINGIAQRFDKEGVFACEPDGQDYYTAPDLIVYMSVLLQTLPEALSEASLPTADIQLSNSAFNAKLAVTSPGGSVYPMHIDNPEGLAMGDTRKLTCILYLNPSYQPLDGGELQLVVEKNKIINLTPEGGRLVVFWSDAIPHQVLPTAPNADSSDKSFDRYALTVWIPTDNMGSIHNPDSKFKDLAGIVFSS